MITVKFNKSCAFQSSYLYIKLNLLFFWGFLHKKHRKLVSSVVLSMLGWRPGLKRQKQWSSSSAPFHLMCINYLWKTINVKIEISTERTIYTLELGCLVKKEKIKKNHSLQMEEIGRKFSASLQGFHILCMNLALYGSNILISTQRVSEMNKNPNIMGLESIYKVLQFCHLLREAGQSV